MTETANSAEAPNTNESGDASAGSADTQDTTLLESNTEESEVSEETSTDVKAEEQSKETKAEIDTDAKAEVKTEADGSEDETKTTDGPPEKYEFSAPEGVEYHPAVLESYEKVARDSGLNQADAQKMLDTVAPVIQQSNVEQIEAMHEDWKKQTTEDKDIGGDNLKATINTSLKAVETFGDDDFRNLLEETNLGSHPSVLRFLNRVGRATSEDGFVGGGDPAVNNVPVSQQSNAQIGKKLYTNPTSQ